MTNEKHIIQYYTKHVYGVQKFYPADDTTQAILRKFNGHKTLTPTDFEAFSALDYGFVEVFPPKS